MYPVLFDRQEVWEDLLPFTFTRPVSEIRCGIFTLREKWEQALGQFCGCISQDYLSRKFPSKTGDDNLFICSHLIPDEKLVKAVQALKPGEALFTEKQLLAYRNPKFMNAEVSKLKAIKYSEAFETLEKPWNIFQKCGKGIVADMERIANKRSSQKLSDTVTVVGDKKLVFLDEGARVEACILNTVNGPIYIGKEAEIMEGCTVRGPFSLGKQSVLKMGAKIYGPTVIGPYCKVGGEVNNSVIFGYSNKAHDGFLGNSVLGEWCNLGADTNNSNLKNNYANVKVYSFKTRHMEDSGLQFCGLLMGDHSKSGINTMFNTGTVVGVGCNIFGGGFPPAYIPNFSWGGGEGLQTYLLGKLFETAEKVFERRDLIFDDKEKAILEAVAKF